MVEQYIDYQETNAGAVTFGYWMDTTDMGIADNYFWTYMEVEMPLEEVPVSDGWVQMHLSMTCPTTGYVSGVTCMMKGVDAFEDSRRIETSYAISHSSREDTYDWDAEMAEFMTDTKDETTMDGEEWGH